jgi:16S rRNA (guanine(966)-N(2))-methyltransferase RsmD
MRVIAGSLKGRRLKAPAWDGLRPTSDKLRETLFSILATRMPGARVIDGYAGTGAIGIEALSRGAATVTFVEGDRRAQELIAENLAHCGVERGCAIIRASVARAIADLRAAGASFDVVLLDPPYDQQYDVDAAAAADILAPGGIVVVEHARRRPPPGTLGRLVKVRDVRSGDSALSFYALPAEH